MFLTGCGLLAEPPTWAGRAQYTVLENGFGLGVNFLATWAAWRADPQRPARLHYVAIERYPARAADLLREGVAERRALWQEHPAEAMRLRDYAMSLAMLGDVEVVAGRKADACGRYDEVERIFGHLARGGRATALDSDSTLRLVREAREEHCRGRP